MVLVKIENNWEEFESFKTLFQKFQTDSIAIVNFENNMINLLDKDNNPYSLECATVGLDIDTVNSIKTEIDEYRTFMRNYVMEVERGGIKIPKEEKLKLKRGFDFLNNNTEQTTKNKEESSPISNDPKPEVKEETETVSEEKEEKPKKAGRPPKKEKDPTVN